MYNLRRSLVFKVKAARTHTHAYAQTTLFLFRTHDTAGWQSNGCRQILKLGHCACKLRRSCYPFLEGRRVRNEDVTYLKKHKTLRIEISVQFLLWCIWSWSSVVAVDVDIVVFHNDTHHFSCFSSAVLSGSLRRSRSQTWVLLFVRQGFESVSSWHRDARGCTYVSIS